MEGRCSCDGEKSVRVMWSMEETVVGYRNFVGREGGDGQMDEVVRVVLTGGTESALVVEASDSGLGCWQ